ncbi:pilus assembly protein PilX [Psychrobacter namhaensis]|uniref:pilus assembly protein PilX n=1 Tax=Psychrobacter namhaensis TaxID=292734 RepID=UPI0018DF8C9D|nr:pilus assembly protein PilX [Psychrobacter namhaensis]
MSNMYPYRGSTTPATQQGAVLIVVLLFLVLIIMAGVIAVRQSTTDLKLSTSDQINTLLLQSADNANQNIEQSINSDSSSDIYKDMLSRSGPFGYFMLDDKGRNNEYVFCFRPRDRFFNINSTTIRTPDGGSVMPSTTGYCNPAKPDDYVSNRNASMTQVNVSMTPPSPTTESFANYTLGQGSDKVSSTAFLFDINNISVLPAYGNTKIGSKDCFAQTSRPSSSADKTDTISGCLSSAGVPNTTVYQKARVENQSLRTKCVNFGKGAGVVCTLPPN